MTFYKNCMNAIVRHSRPFSTRIVQKGPQTWFRELEIHPEITAFMNQPTLSKDQWIRFRDKIEKNSNTDRAISLDLVIMQLCNSLKNFDLGKCFMKYLTDNKSETNAAVVGKYLQLFYLNRKNLTEDDKREIVFMYRQLRLKYPLLDGQTAESCILALSLTDSWRESEELLEILKISCSKASTTSYSAIVEAAFENGDPEIGWKYFNELVEQKKRPSSESYIAYVDYCLNNFQDADNRVKEIEKLLTFLAQHNLLPDKIVTDHIKQAFKKLGWTGSFSTINETGTCTNCQHKLAPLILSEKDFSHLAKTVFDRVIVGENVYSRTTPSELNKFVKFIDKTKPYDVVIDGLNVGYRNRGTASSAGAARQLATLVRHFLSINKVVLVLGRKHMLKWDERAMSYVKKNSFLFLTSNISEDDPYLLYATLASGPKTEFVSDDLMRKHKFILKDVKLEKTFKQWQMTHQCFLTFTKGKMLLSPPLSYLPVAQSGDNCWHIPYRFSDDPKTETYQPPKEWLCLQSLKSRSE